MERRLEPPVRGAADNTPYIDTPGREGFCPPSRLLNTWPYPTVGERLVMGSRPAVVKAFPQPVAANQPVRGGGVVARARGITSYRIGATTDQTDATTDPKAGDALVGQAFALAPAFGMQWSRYENVSPAGSFADTGPNNQSVNAVACSPDGTKVIIASNYADASTKLVSRVTCLNANTGAVVWSVKIATAGVDRFTNSLCCSDDRVFVCTNRYLHVYRVGDGATVGSDPTFTSSPYNLNGWADEVIQAVLSPGQRTLYVLFRGSSVGLTLPNGLAVSGGIYAQHFRAGVMAFAVPTTVDQTTDDDLRQARIGEDLDSADTYYEADHGYLRFSERMLGGWSRQTNIARGIEPVGLALGDDGSIFVAHANQGWGPKSDGSHGAPNQVGPYATITKFDVNGHWLRSVDTDSIREVGSGGFQNDIPTSGTDPTSIMAIAAGDGRVYVGGRRNSAAGYNAFCYDQDLNWIWAQWLGQSFSGPVQTIRETGVYVHPGTRRVLFAGDRNAAWPGAGGANAHLWELDGPTGVILRTFDVGAAVSALGVCGRTAGDVFYVSDKV